MKRDPHISKLIRESGVDQAPAGFTAGVMNLIEAVPAKNVYKPLIGRVGQGFIILCLVLVIVLTMIYGESSGVLFGTGGKLSQLEWQLPQFTLNLEFLKNINLSTSLVSAVVSIFILVLFDTVLSKRRLT